MKMEYSEGKEAGPRPVTRLHMCKTSAELLSCVC